MQTGINVRYWPKADIPHCTAHVRFRGAKRTSRSAALSVDNLGGVLVRINDRNYDNRISFLNFSSGSYSRFFAAERTFYL
jgi:hypothetical protein